MTVTSSCGIIVYKSVTSIVMNVVSCANGSNGGLKTMVMVGDFNYELLVIDTS